MSGQTPELVAESRDRSPVHVVQPGDRSKAGGFWRWQWEAFGDRLRTPRRDVRFDPVTHAVASPRAAAGELRATWIGHATVLLQTPAANLLFDPIWSVRASPVQWAGPARHAAPGVPIAELPRLDAVLVSHDHYDHLDRPTVETLVRAVPSEQPMVVTPLGYRRWMRARGAAKVRELTWLETHTIAGTGVRVTALPVRHWSRRSLVSASGGTNRRSWCAYFVESDGFRVFFCGDSGWFDGLRVLGRRVAPLDLAILPIGAYEPRWFMRDHHMNPDEAVMTYEALGGRGMCMGIHWGTFALTDEPLDEPPARMRRAWSAAGLPAEALWIPRHGETRAIPRGEPRSA